MMGIHPIVARDHFRKKSVACAANFPYLMTTRARAALRTAVQPPLCAVADWCRGWARVLRQGRQKRGMRCGAALFADHTILRLPACWAIAAASARWRWLCDRHVAVDTERSFSTRRANLHCNGVALAVRTASWPSTQGSSGGYLRSKARPRTVSTCLPLRGVADRGGLARTRWQRPTTWVWVAAALAASLPATIWAFRSMPSCTKLAHDMNNVIW